MKKKPPIEQSREVQHSLFATSNTGIKNPVNLVALISLVVLLCSPATRLWGEDIGDAALLLEVKGAIGPGLSDFIRRGLEKANEDKARLVILQIDTPGGLDLSMREIIKNILTSETPVVSYVAPSGSRAASAGTYILYASHVAAMAPATNLGAATPVTIGSLPGGGKEPEHQDQSKQDQDKKKPAATLHDKMVNDAEAYIVSLAEKHGRNKEWAAKAVREAVSIGAEEALRLGVIDLMANNVDDLLIKLHGREVVLESGRQRLNTENIRVVPMEKDWRTRLLMIIGDPNIAYMLMLLGFYGLLFELANPGYVLPGVIGGTALLLALYAFQVLPVNYAGLALIVLGLSFMVAEAFTPSFGALGIGGLVAFIFGSVILMDEQGLQVSRFLIGSTGLFSLACILLLIGKVLTIRRKKVATGKEQLLDSTGVVMEDFTENGRVWVLGESWLASCSTPLKKGDRVRVLSREGLKLFVEPLQEVK